MTTYVRVMHLRKYILTFNLMCTLLRNRVVHLVDQSEECNVLCVRIGDDRDEGVFVIVHQVQTAPMTVQWHDPTTAVRFHLTNLSQLVKCAAEMTRNSCHYECPVHESAEKTCVRCGVCPQQACRLSHLHSQCSTA